ncbi:MAG: hypothetical protein V1800_01635 [Candidatus Latescibacterota bacterium]
MDRTTLKKYDFDRDEIGRRKQHIRDLWAGKPVNHIPLLITVTDPHAAWPIRDQLQDADKQLEVALRNAGLTWQSVPEGDTIPAIRPDVGCSCLATAFGAELFWGDTPDQTCGIKTPLLSDLEAAYSLPVPLPDAGQLGEGTRRVGRFAAAGEGVISVSLLDMAGGLNVANDLLGGEALYLAMYENPEALACLLGKIQTLFLSTMALQLKAAGGEEAITTTDFPDTWFPEGQKGHVSDDISANISPALYQRFSLPYHNLIFEQYGGGGLHNCGPNPCLASYLAHTPAPRSLDLSYRYSRCDLGAIKQHCRKRALVYMGEFPSEPQEAVDTFREIMELMTPDVVVIPIITVTPEADPAALYGKLRPISEEYAKRMDWGWE